MSAPTSKDPLFVNTAGGQCWKRQHVDGDGRGLYALADVVACPAYVLASFAELAELGVVGSADVLPVPVLPEPQALSAAEVRLSQYGEQRGTYGSASEKALYHIALDLRKELSGQRAYEQRLREQHDLDVAELNRLRARVAELLAERHSTNEAPDGKYPPALPWAALMDDEDRADFLDELAAAATTLADSEVVLAEVEKACATWRLIAEAQHGHNTAPGPDERPVNELTSVFSPVASLRELDGEHYPLVHHDYRVSHDLPETGGTQ